MVGPKMRHPRKQASVRAPPRHAPTQQAGDRSEVPEPLKLPPAAVSASAVPPLPQGGRGMIGRHVPPHTSPPPPLVPARGLGPPPQQPPPPQQQQQQPPTSRGRGAGARTASSSIPLVPSEAATADGGGSKEGSVPRNRYEYMLHLMRAAEHLYRGVTDKAKRGTEKFLFVSSRIKEHYSSWPDADIREAIDMFVNLSKVAINTKNFLSDPGVQTVAKSCFSCCC